MIRVRVFKRRTRKHFEAEWTDPVTGQQRRKTTGESTRRGAERFAAELEDDLNAGLDDAGAISWEDFRKAVAAEFLPTYPSASQRKITAALRHVERILKPRRLANVTGRQLSRLRSVLLAGDEEANRRPQRPATIKGHFSYLRTVFKWALEAGLLARLPTIPDVRVTPSAKGRPITGEEFERYVQATRDGAAKIFDEDHDAVRQLVTLLHGLWWSGLRLGEALALHWTDDSEIAVRLGMDPPMFLVRAETDKGRRERLFPIAPQFVEQLRETPERRRRGHVFRLPVPRRVDDVSKLLAEFGRASGVWVSPEKCVSAHDLRRSFGDRWSEVLLPQDLMLLMRHQSIETTMRFYVGRDAARTGRKLWSVHAGSDRFTTNVPSGESSQD